MVIIYVLKEHYAKVKKAYIPWLKTITDASITSLPVEAVGPTVVGNTVVDCTFGVPEEFLAELDRLNIPYRRA
ncbi:hypothetical protein [Chromobacterium subtsugae]|uniref:hypothetical protein n=1 Tax=Chromobacterium subtsugae TaxID=251747 RepID=UPI00128DF75E|nr:hypothetical protein [Chromobacterium subtsugae]